MIYNFLIPPAYYKCLHSSCFDYSRVEIFQLVVEISNCNTSTKRSSNLSSFVKISKSGDGGGSGDISDMPVQE
jgi:hypothetical protein